MYKRLIIPFIVALLVVQFSVAQTASFFAGGAHAESLAHTNTTFQGVTGLYGNIAGLAYVEGFAGDVSFDNRYSLIELSTASIGAAYGSSYGTFGMMASKYGFEAYSENKIGLAYAMKLGRGLSLGAMFDVFQYSVEGYGSATKMTFEASVYSELTDKVHLGASFFSPQTVSLTNVQDIPARLSFGVKYFVSPKATIYADVTKVDKQDAEFKFAVSYQLHKRLGLRLGSNVLQSAFYAGLYFPITDDLRITGAYSYHQKLGNTPSISLSYGLVK